MLAKVLEGSGGSKAKPVESTFSCLDEVASACGDAPFIVPNPLCASYLARSEIYEFVARPPEGAG